MDPADLLTPEGMLRRLDWQVVRRLDGRLQGDYRTLLRGDGTDFLDLRAYEWGDDVRHIDWNATARMDELLVRDFMEDRELTAWLLLDRSRSMAFGPAGRTKEHVLCELAASLRPAARPERQSGGGHHLRRGAPLGAPATARPEPRPRADAAPAPTGRGSGVDRPRQALPHGRATRASTLARGRDLRFRQRARLGTTAPPPHPATRGRRGPDGGSARARTSRLPACCTCRTPKQGRCCSSTRAIRSSAAACTRWLTIRTTPSASRSLGPESISTSCRPRTIC